MEASVARQNIVSGLVVVCVAAAAFLLTFGMPGDAVIFPRIASAILFFLGALLVIAAAKGNRATAMTSEKPVRLSEARNPAVALLIVVSYVFGIRFLGFYSSTLAVLPVFMRFFGITSAFRVALVTIAVSAIVYLVFSVQLGVLLPTGILY